MPENKTNQPKTMRHHPSGTNKLRNSIVVSPSLANIRMEIAVLDLIRRIQQIQRQPHERKVAVLQALGRLVLGARRPGRKDGAGLRALEGADEGRELLDAVRVVGLEVWVVLHDVVGDVDDGDFHLLDFFLVVLCAVGGDGTREGGAGEGQGGCDGGELHDCSLVGLKVDLMGDGCAVGER